MITISFNLNNFNFLKLATSRLSDGPTPTEQEEEKSCGYEIWMLENIISKFLLQLTSSCPLQIPGGCAEKEMIWTFSEPRYQAVWVIWWDTGWEERIPRPAVQVRRLQCREICLSWPDWDHRTGSWLLLLRSEILWKSINIHQKECQTYLSYWYWYWHICRYIVYWLSYLWSSWPRPPPGCPWRPPVWRPDISGISAYRQPRWSYTAGRLTAGSGRRGTGTCSAKYQISNIKYQRSLCVMHDILVSWVVYLSMLSSKAS